MATPRISFVLRHDGYALLTLDQLARVEDTRPPTRKANSGLSVPPLRTPLCDHSDQSAQLTSGLNRTWYIFFESLLKRAQATGADLTAVKFLCPSIDEEDILTYGTGTLDATTNPVTFTPGLGAYYSRYGVQFAVGDWIVWHDAPVFEIDRIDSISNGRWTVSRGEFTSAAGAHADQRFWRLEPKVFTLELLDGKVPELVQFPWANKCVAAIRSWGEGSNGAGTAYTLNLSTSTVPGYRTMNGAAYTNIGIAGDLAVNQRAGARISVQAWESVRCIYGSLRTPADADVTVAVVYIAPGDVEADRVCALIGKITIPALAYRSWLVADPPDGRQLPYGGSYPPNLLPVVGTLGTLSAPVSATAGAAIVFAPDGEIDLVVETIGTTAAGTDLSVTVQS